MSIPARAKSGVAIAGRMTVPARATPAIRRLNRVVGDASVDAVELQIGNSRVRVPAEIVDMLRLVTNAAIAGDAVTVSVVSAGDKNDELTSQQAADVLNVSRPHVVKLAREGVLPHRMVGNRHRFLASDVQACRQREASRRAEVLAGLAPEGGYSFEDF
ncbi:MAG: helix-turn-helix domain-containing protein [Actinomycetota bacterium]|nr:helix-turn-helix domain-containing protein [Actinomycetota bacterium]